MKFGPRKLMRSWSVVLAAAVIMGWEGARVVKSGGISSAQAI